MLFTAEEGDDASLKREKQNKHDQYGSKEIM